MAWAQQPVMRCGPRQLRQLTPHAIQLVPTKNWVFGGGLRCGLDIERGTGSLSGPGVCQARAPGDDENGMKGGGRRESCAIGGGSRCHSSYGAASECRWGFGVRRRGERAGAGV